MRCQRIFRDRLNPLDAYSDVEFIARYRITRAIFTELIDILETFTNRSTSRPHPIAMTTQLAVTSVVFCQKKKWGGAPFSNLAFS